MVPIESLYATFCVPIEHVHAIFAPKRFLDLTPSFCAKVPEIALLTFFAYKCLIYALNSPKCKVFVQTSPAHKTCKFHVNLKGFTFMGQMSSQNWGFLLFLGHKSHIMAYLTLNLAQLCHF